MTLMVGCGTKEDKKVETEPTKQEVTTEPTKEETKEPSEENVKTVTMKFAGTAAADAKNGEYQAMLKFEELVEKYSNGTVQVEVYPASQLGTSTEFTEGVSLGTVE